MENNAVDNPGKGLGIASMILGIAGLIPFSPLAIVGLILGIVSKKKSSEVGASAGMATAGIICSIIGIIFSIIITSCVICLIAANS